jgi:hypothetical protein
VSSVAKTLFIPMVHSPLVGCETSGNTGAPPRRGRARSHGTRDSAGAHLSIEVRFRAEEHVVVLELTTTTM